LNAEEPQKLLKPVWLISAILVDFSHLRETVQRVRDIQAARHIAEIMGSNHVLKRDLPELEGHV